MPTMPLGQHMPSPSQPWPRSLQLCFSRSLCRRDRGREPGFLQEPPCGLPVQQPSLPAWTAPAAALASRTAWHKESGGSRPASGILPILYTQDHSGRRFNEGHMANNRMAPEGISRNRKEPLMDYLSAVVLSDMLCLLHWVARTA